MLLHCVLLIVTCTQWDNQCRFPSSKIHQFKLHLQVYFESKIFNPYNFKSPFPIPHYTFKYTFPCKTCLIDIWYLSFSCKFGTKEPLLINSLGPGHLVKRDCLKREGLLYLAMSDLGPEIIINKEGLLIERNG